MLRAAGEVFSAHGFHDASMDQIAARAGITKPMLYNYFGSKLGLYRAYARSSGTELLRGLRDAAAPDAPVQERLWAGILAFLGHVEEHPARWTVLQTQTTAQGDPMAAEVREWRERAAAMLQTFFGDEAFAHAFTGACESVASWWLAHPDRPKPEVAAVLMSIAVAHAPTASPSPSRGQRSTK